MTVTTDANGFAFAYGLTAGQQPGDVAVTASPADGPVNVKPATYTLHVLSFGSLKSGGRPVQATICPTQPGGRRQKPACATRDLLGTFPPLLLGVTATLARGPVIYAAGHATAGYRKITLLRRRRITPGRYSLVLRGPRHSMIVPVTLLPPGEGTK
jgi:hypothetical protein